MHLTVLDLDGALTRQPLFQQLIAGQGAQRIDLRPLSPKLRILASHPARHDLLLATEQLHERGPGGPPVVFYGSGDFHHVTASLLAHYDEPLTVIHFDNHPDWVRWPATHNCGGWVCRALELPHVQRVVTLGPSSGDLVRPELQLADMDAVERGVLEVYPWRHPPSRVFRFYRDTACSWYDKRLVHWQELAGLDWGAFLDDLIARLPTEAVYITIDKDVLGADEAVTNWDQGGMPLAHILTAVERVAARCRVVGVDVCGEYSPAVFPDPLRRMLAAIDHPRQPNPSAVELARNEATNAKLLACFRSALA